MIGAALCGLSALGWWATLPRVFKVAARTSHKLGPEDAPPTGKPVVAVVVPARDEVEHIRGCVDAVLAQTWPELTLTVLDDGSTDGTTATLADLLATHPKRHRLQVVTGDPNTPLPPGWLGKPWACERAAKAALAHAPATTHLLFIDADVRLSPAAVAVALGHAERHNLDLLSIMGRLDHGSMWEAAVQPAIVGLLLAGNDLDRINDPERRPDRPLANGQFLLFSRAAYTAISGHNAVKQAIVDDVELAVAVCNNGGRYHLLFGPRVFRVRMYAGLAELWAGWSKNLFLGLDQKWGLVWGLVGFASAFVVWPWVAVVVGLLTLDWVLLGTAVAAVAGMVQVRRSLDKRFHQPSEQLWLLPVGWAILAAIAVNSGIQTTRGTSVWKGRALPKVGESSKSPSG